MPENIEPTNNQVRKSELLDYFLVFLRWRKLIVTNIAVVTLLAAAVSFLLPKWYKATSAILPPKEQDALGLAGGSSVLRNIAGVQKLGGLGQKMGAYNYLAVLNSRSAMEMVAKTFDLVNVYDIGDSSMERTIKALRDNVEFVYQDDEYITIEVMDRDPQRAADMANYFVQTLNQISIKLGTQESKNNREFIEKRLLKCREDLHNAEEALKEFQEKAGALISPPQEGNTGLSGIVELYATKVKKEIELAVLERSVTKDNPLLLQGRIELSEIDKKVSQFPEAGIGALRLYRDVAIQQKILEFIVPLYEQAKVDEQKNVPVILVLDTAIPPELKTKPKRIIFILLWSLVAFTVSAVYVLAKERFETISPEGKGAALVKEIRSTSLYKFVFRKKGAPVA